MRSLSAVITFHNKEYKPRRNGLCVANHTTTIDVAVLATETSFSLVSKKFFLVGKKITVLRVYVWAENCFFCEGVKNPFV